MPSTKKQGKRKPIYEYRCSGRILVGYVEADGTKSVLKPKDVVKAEEKAPSKKKND